MNGLIGILILIVVAFVILKVAQLAFKLIFFISGLLLVFGALYYVFMR